MMRRPIATSALRGRGCASARANSTSGTASIAGMGRRRRTVGRVRGGATCLSQTRTKRRHLSIPVDQASKPLTRSQQMIAKIDTVEGRKQYRRRLEIVEPVFGNIRTQKRRDHFTLRGKQKVDSQWLLYAMVHNIEKIANYGEAA
jgi:hypothetical protein